MEQKAITYSYLFVIVGTLLVFAFLAVPLWQSVPDTTLSGKAWWGSKKPQCTPEELTCGKNCCEVGDTCYNGLCCPQGQVREEITLFKILTQEYCKEVCSPQEKQCGQTCCAQGEQCITQLGGVAGQCIPPNTKEENKCKDENGRTVDACQTNEECTKAEVGNILKKFPVYGCLPTSCPAGEQICKGEGMFEEYKICCSKCGKYSNGIPRCI